MVISLLANDCLPPGWCFKWFTTCYRCGQLDGKCNDEIYVAKDEILFLENISPWFATKCMSVWKCHRLAFIFIQVIQFVNFAPYIFVQLCSNMPCWSVNLFDFAQEKLLECFSLSAIFPVQNLTN